MSLAPESSTVKRALSAHAAIGLLAGALLYLISLSGTLAVLYQEWQRIEQPAAPEMTAISPEAVQRAAREVLKSETDRPTTTHLFVHMPVEGLPRTTITTDHQARHVDAQGHIAGPEEIAWSDFLVELHYTLNIPGPVGITIVGIMGVMMLTLILSGVVAHPRIFRDAFRLRVRGKGGVGLADWHNRLSVWTLPFSLAVALTGAMIGMATVTAFGVAQASYDGDMEKVYAPIFGEEAAEEPARAPMPDIAAALRHMQALHPEVTVTYVILHDPLTVGQHVQLVGEHDKRLVFGEYYHFDARGHFDGTTGLADGSVGQQVAASSYRLHFGNFGGLPVKLAYVAFGAALTAICATGVYIWLGKRGRRGVHEPRLQATWHAVVCGTPVMLAITFAVRKLIGNDAPLALIFWLGMGAVLVAAPWFAGRGLILRRGQNSPALSRG